MVDAARRRRRFSSDACQINFRSVISLKTEFVVLKSMPKRRTPPAVSGITIALAPLFGGGIPPYPTVNKLISQKYRASTKLKWPTRENAAAQIANQKLKSIA